MHDPDSPPPDPLLEVAEALMDIAPLQDEAGRNTFVTTIGQILRRPLDAPVHPIPRIFLLNVTAECQRRDGGLEALLQVVDFMAGDSYAAARVRQALSPVLRHFDAAAERDIRSLLEGYVPPSLTRLYHTAAENLMSAPRELSDAWQAFSLLEEANAGPDGLSPHLMFVVLVIQVMERQKVTAPGLSEHDAARLAKLREWVNARLAELRAQGGREAADRLDQIRSKAEPLTRHTDLPLHLIIQLEPIEQRGPDGRLYRMSHWKQLHPLEWRPQPGGDEILPLGQVSQRVGELVHEAETDWAYGFDDTLVLEFVLPMDLLNLAVEEWTRDPPDEPDPTPLGVEYEILVRSLDRMYSRAHHRAWRRRWNTLSNGTDDCVTRWIPDEAPAAPHRLRDELMNRWEVVACVLSTAPDREPGRTEVRMALRAGLPVLIWHRGEGFSQDLLAALREVIGRPNEQLPGEIRKLRGGARANTDISAQDARQVALLHDDPRHFLDGVRPLRPPRI